MSNSTTERVKRLNNIFGYVSTDPLDHDKLINRDEKDQHPISAITNLEAVISELKGFNEYIGELESVNVGDEQVTLTMFVLEERKRTPRLNDLIRINDRAEIWRHNGDGWEFYNRIGEIPLATDNIVGGVKLDQKKFTLDESGYLSYNIANDEAHQKLTDRIDELSEEVESKVTESKLSEVVADIVASNGIDDGRI